MKALEKVMCTLKLSKGMMKEQSCSLTTFPSLKYKGDLHKANKVKYDPLYKI